MSAVSREDKLKLCLVICFLIGGVCVANAENVFCLPAASQEWNGVHWQFPAFSGPLSEVSLSASMFDAETTEITCKRGSMVAYAFVKKKCRFAPGSEVTRRVQLKGQALVCHLNELMNDRACTIECDG